MLTTQSYCVYWARQLEAERELITHEQSDKVIDDPRIKGVALTGSVAAGRSISSCAGTSLKVSSMELGGADAFIVLEDADLEKTIPWAVWGRMYNAGQTCCASKRFIVVDEIADEFLAKFKAALEEMYVNVAILKETAPHERRVAVVPSITAELV